MITLSVNFTTAAELETILDTLDKRNLLSGPVAVSPVSKPVPAAPKPAGAVRGNGGSWFKENAIRQQEYLAEHGLDARPVATEQEMALRAKIDKAREKAGEKGVNWKVDVISRHKIMLEHGYDIFGQDGTQPAVTEPDDEPLPAIDLDNSVA